MKSLTITLLILFVAGAGLCAQDAEKPEKDGVVKVKLTDDPSDLPQVETKKDALSGVEIEVVDKVNVITADSDSSNAAAKNTSAVKIIPTQPDNNLMIYFILLMVIVVGIMLLASIIPGPSSTRTEK